MALAGLNLVSVPPVHADVLDNSLIVRLNFDAAPVGDVIVDTSPAGGHPGTNNLATWVATEVGRQGVMNFDGLAKNQITVTLTGSHNSFPDYEGYADGNNFYQYSSSWGGPNPINLGVTWHNIPSRTKHVIDNVELPVSSKQP